MPKISPKRQIENLCKNHKCKEQKKLEVVNVKREPTEIDKMYQLATWNKGMRRKREYSAELQKVISSFESGCKIIDPRLIPSHDQNYLVRKLKTKRRNKHWVEWRCDMSKIFTEDQKHSNI